MHLNSSLQIISIFSTYATLVSFNLSLEFYRHVLQMLQMLHHLRSPDIMTDK